MSGGEIECPYQLIELVGEGGMGQVFLARHKGLNRMEALKVLAPRLAKAKDFVARLRRESRAASMLTHPNIVAVFGLGRLDDGRYYLAMEYLSGETLEAIVDREGALPEALGLRYLYQLASAMAQAHEQSVVHRDIKPANIMVVDQETPYPSIKVLDFGLAKIINPNYVDSVRSSVAGSIYGTPGFMAPERVQGVPSVPNMDIYSFGCVAYNLMTGRAPFTGSPMEVLSAHQSKMPPLPSEGSKVNKELEAIIMRCLSKNPAERPQNGEVLCAAIEAITGFSAQEARRRGSVSSTHEAVNATADTLIPLSNENSQSTLVDMRIGPAVAGTYDLVSTSAELNYRKSLLALARSVVEGGCQDKVMVMAFAAVHQAEDARTQHTEALSILFDEGHKLEQSFRREQSSLRFALGELIFDAAEEGKGADRQELESLANDLTEDLMRVEYQFERDLKKIVDREVTRTAERDALKDSLKDQYVSLLQLVDCNVESVELTPVLDSLVGDFQKAKRVYDKWLRERS